DPTAARRAPPRTEREPEHGFSGRHSRQSNRRAVVWNSPAATARRKFRAPSVCITNWVECKLAQQASRSWDQWILFTSRLGLRLGSQRLGSCHRLENPAYASTGTLRRVLPRKGRRGPRRGDRPVSAVQRKPFRSCL